MTRSFHLDKESLAVELALEVDEGRTDIPVVGGLYKIVLRAVGPSVEKHPAWLNLANSEACIFMREKYNQKDIKGVRVYDLCDPKY